MATKPADRQRPRPEPAATGWRSLILRLLWAGFLTLLIAGPWLGPGYVFGTDFPGPRHFPFPSGPTSFSVLEIALWALGLVFTGEVVGKVLIVLVIFATALTAYLAVPVGEFVPRSVASLVYLVNPFVYERLAYGQLTVLAGYAALPWIAYCARSLASKPSIRGALILAMAVVVTSILDVHLAVIGTLVLAAVMLAYGATRRRDAAYLKRLCTNLTATALVAALASAYWLIPLALGRGTEAAVVAGIGQNDFYAFRAVPDPTLGLIPNILGLYGFWAESTGRFASMKDFVVVWPLVLALLLLLAVVGGIETLGDRKVLGVKSLRPYVIALLFASSIALVFEAGVSDSHLAPAVKWLASVFPPYRGMRDAGKWAAVLALTYSQLVPLGVAHLLNLVRQMLRHGQLQQIARATLTGLVMAMCLYYGNGLLYGIHGQVKLSSYPAGWYAVDGILAADRTPGRALFLPWHGYMAMSFVRNTNRVVGNPAPQFFSIPIVASQDLEIPGIRPRVNPDQGAVARLVAGGSQADWAPALTAHGIKYVIVAKEVDWHSYEFLRAEPGIVLVGDFGAILLYRNASWTAS